jgi:hypothetical protein
VAIFDALDVVFTLLGECFEVVVVTPFRYIFSPKYRRSKHAEWSEYPWFGVLQFGFGACCLALTLSLVAYIVISSLPS